MNTEILKKCLSELQMTAPRIDYVCGMLETLIAMQPVAAKEKYIEKPDKPIVVTGNSITDIDMPLYTPPSRLDEIRRMSDESAHL